MMRVRSHRLVHTDKSRFWEVHWEGADVETTSGALGTNGRATVKSFGAVHEADEWVTVQLAKKRREGFTELNALATRPAGDRRAARANPRGAR